ncbi:tripartite motif-containing protein 3-like [Branchiostoma lanceolatum]|uniref:tripartite motif-containing protein 3-like n=1 Tax=Branchiostoma lanceolatum TaxID=7740 RepID=UPI0034539297
MAASPSSLGTHFTTDKARQGERQPQRITFGGKGSDTGRFWYPRGVTVSEGGEIFVADSFNNRIQVFTLQGTFLCQYLTLEPGGRKINPQDVALDGKGNLWVVGAGGTESPVKKNKQGRVMRGTDLQKTVSDRGVAVDTRNNHILITHVTDDAYDSAHGEVLVFSPAGELVRTVGGDCSWTGWFASLLWRQGMRIKDPQYITVDGEGNILVSDWGNHSVYVCNEDGVYLFQFGGGGSGEGQLKHPCGICTDRAGNIIVADMGNSRVEMFDKTGRFLKHITTDIEKPQAVAMAPQGQLVVTDAQEHSVSIFQNF